MSRIIALLLLWPSIAFAQLSGLTVPGVTPIPPTLQVVGTMTGFPARQNASGPISTTGYTQYQDECPATVTVAVSSLEWADVNAYITGTQAGNGEVSAGLPTYTLSSAVRVPGGSTTQFLYGGSGTKSVTTGTFTTSDSLSISIAAGTQIGLRRNMTTSATSNVMSGARLGMDATAAGATSPLTGNGYGCSTLWDPSTNASQLTNGVMPFNTTTGMDGTTTQGKGMVTATGAMALLGVPTTANAGSFEILGDSWPAGGTDVADSCGIVGFAKGFETSTNPLICDGGSDSGFLYPLVNFSVGLDYLQDEANNNTYRIGKLCGLIHNYFNFAMPHDILQGGDTVATVEGYLRTLWTTERNCGANIYEALNPPQPCVHGANANGCGSTAGGCTALNSAYTVASDISEPCQRYVHGYYNPCSQSPGAGWFLTCGAGQLGGTGLNYDAAPTGTFPCTSGQSMPESGGGTCDFMAATLDEYIISQVCVLIQGAWDPKSGEVWGCSNGSVVHSTPSSTHHGAGNIIGGNTPNDPFIFAWGTDCWSYTQTGTTHGNTTLDGLTSTGGVFSVGAVWLLSAADITAGTAVSSVTSGTALVMGAAASGSNTETVTFYPQGCSNGLLHYNDGSVYPLADSIRYGLQNYFSPRL